MKNVYLLPTDKPSRLFKDNSQALNLHTHPVMKGMFTNGIGSNQHLYITSDEEIKLSNWACHKGITNDKYQLVKCTISNKESIQEHWNKVILTTDQDLIKDDVQAIDDEFLDWFVKNPSCEVVKIDSIPVNEFGSEIIVTGYGFDKFIYKIIIPKEEPKQETTIEDAAEKIAMDKLKSKWEHLYIFGYPQKPFPTNYENDLNNVKVGLYEGAKLQEERMYTKEEVTGMLFKVGNAMKYKGVNYASYFNYKNVSEEVNKVLEQFKKK